MAEGHDDEAEGPKKVSETVRRRGEAGMDDVGGEPLTLGLLSEKGPLGRKFRPSQSYVHKVLGLVRRSPLVRG